jgi:hypothetical protein
MNDEEETLREIFSAHEYLAPDPVAVRAGIRNRARAYARRRKAAQAAGGAVLGAGLVTVGVAAPYLARNTSTHATAGVSALGVAPATASPSPVSSQDVDQALNAYFNAGYTYDDAMQLAKLWNMPDNTVATKVKAAAGQRLLAGEQLPIKPGSTPASPVDAAESADVNAFFDAGYTYDDALSLAKMWNSADAYHAKVTGGQKLLAGETLPIKPGSTASSIEGAPVPSLNGQDGTDIDAFFNAGYTYDDAVQLGKLWKMSDLYQVKATAGEKVAAGETLPIAPGSTATDKKNAAESAGVEAFFNAGYSYDDAVELGKLWKNSNTYQVKITAGQKLIAGETLPIKP